MVKKNVKPSPAGKTTQLPCHIQNIKSLDKMNYRLAFKSEKKTVTEIFSLNYQIL